MITSAFIQVIYLFLLGITKLISNLGEVPANNDFTTSILTFKQYYLSLDAFLPLSVILGIVAFDLAFEGIYFLYKGIKWGYQKVPMVN
jgi:hypothetical protein